MRLPVGRLVLGRVGNAAVGAWWLNPTVGLLIAGLAVKEGAEAWRGEGCCAHPGTRTDGRDLLRRRLLPHRELNPVRYTGCGMVLRMESAGDFLRARRLANGLSQTQLALRAGTSQAAICSIERNEREPSIPTLAGLLRVMGEDLQLAASPTGHRYRPDDLDHAASRTTQERLEDALGCNGFADEITGVALAALVRQ